MTIVAGFVNDNGVLMACDTMFSSDTSVRYGSKILPVVFQDGRALIAFSGVETFARSAIERIGLSLNRYNGHARPIGEIAEQVRKMWFSAFREEHHGNDLSYDQIMAAIWSSADSDVRLYCSSNGSFAESMLPVQCIGCGDMLSQYLIGSEVSSGKMPERQAFERSVRALGIVKAFMPSSVGGNIMAVNLTANGTVNLYGRMDIEQVEAFSLELDNSARRMCCAFASINDRTAIKTEVKGFIDHMVQMRKQWREEIKMDLKDYAPRETVDIWRAFTPFRQAARSCPQSTTADQSRQQPSPELPEGSDES